MALQQSANSAHKYAVPFSEFEMMREWRELAMTGSTDGDYGENSESCSRKYIKDLAWIVDHWGVTPESVRQFVDAAIERGTLQPLGKLIEVCPDKTSPVLSSMDLVAMVLKSSCSTSYVERREDKQHEMVQWLVRNGFQVSARDQTEVKRLSDAVAKRLEKKQQSQASAEAKAKAAAKRVHPGRLETHNSDLSGLDSTELRHVEATYQIWSCCKRGPDAPGCKDP
eukprot:TRINITY_DN30561_c0_g1_i1.p1 TRINITY_DN30561_c0_g1~~TRINITY_DN30561_c0_g1_i1.p1  ORF type:complete len:225 (+),score=28.70 TRINITY_DN30561_c0_g1_i1:70-744(+)